MLLVPLLACAPDPYREWPEPTETFPWVYTAETDLEPYEEVRWETETWTLESDPDLAALYLLKAVEHRKGAPVESLDHFAAMRAAVPPPGAGTSLSFVGDVMWIGGNWDAFATPAAALLDGDFRTGNLETPTSPNFPTEPAELGLYTFNAPPAILDGLPLDLLQVTNNHTLDVGDAGLEDTLAEIDGRGFLRAGVDTQAVTDLDGRRVAFLAWTWGVNDRDAVTTHDLHIVPFGHLDAPVDLTPVRDAVADARADGADLVVLLVHWGYEYEYYPDPHFLQLGRGLVEAGADLVVGEGPHVVQPPEICHVNEPEVVPGVGTCSVRTEDGRPRTAAVVYSLGDFGTDLETWPLRTGIVLTTSLDADGVTGLGWAAEATVPGPDGPEIRPLAELVADDADAAAEAERLAAHLGTGWMRPTR